MLRLPIVAIGYVVEQFRRLPGARALGRHSFRIAILLVLAASVAFIVWGLEKAPQRLTLAELAAGLLSPNQSWIIVSGELHGPEGSTSAGYRYRLTDAAAPNATMVVVSEQELAPGPQTISGTYVGMREAVPAGYSWRGQMHADPALVSEQGPPWLAFILVVTGLVVGVAGRFYYPTFFAQEPADRQPHPATLAVSVRRRTPGTPAERVAGTIRLQPGAPVGLRMDGAAEQPLRLHSAYTSLEPGVLQGLSQAEPALRVRQAQGDLEISFGSLDERDATHSALVADSDVAESVSMLGASPKYR